MPVNGSERSAANLKMDIKKRIRGCLLGGAIGDALGAPVEFMCMREIEQHFGSGGITDYSPATWN